MNCQDFKNQLMDLALGELSSVELSSVELSFGEPSSSPRSALEAHASDCPDCGPLLKRIMRTQSLLKQGWRDEEMPTSIIFAPAVEPARTGLWSWLLSAPRWASATMAVAAVVLILFSALSFARVEFRYDQGHAALSFGRRGAGDWATRPAGIVPAVNASFDAGQVEKLVGEKYARMSAEDRAQYAALLDRLATQMNARREADLEKIGTAFDQVKMVVWKDLQRNDAIIQYAAQRIVTQSKN